MHLGFVSSNVQLILRLLMSRQSGLRSSVTIVTDPFVASVAATRILRADGASSSSVRPERPRSILL